MKIKINPLRSLTCCLLALSTAAGLLRADRAADLRNEIIPPGLKMHAPLHRASLPSDSSSPTGNGYTPQQMWHAYGFDRLNTTGEGQIIAIVDAYGSSTIQADLNTFCTAFGLPGTAVQVYYPQGTPPADPGYPGWANETSLDVEWAHAMAPGATIALVIAQSDDNTDLLAAVDYAASLGASQVSLSWSNSEYSTEGTSDFHFNVPGVTFFVSSGDDGEGVNYPTCSPYVVGVGGTTLYLDSSGNYGSETAWSGSGGGASVYEAVPSYQAGWWSGPGRGVPDVAFEADPSTGVPVYLTGYGWGQWGGTSLSCPCWAAFSALANSLRSGSVNSGPGVFYALAAENYAGYYHDIVSGNDGDSAGPGYDLVTGLGTPIANTLVPAVGGSLSSQVFAPVFFPGAGVYPSGKKVAVTLITGTSGASIRYTTDGSTPTETSGTVYSVPVSIGAPTTLTAIAYESGLTASPVTSASYAFLPQVAAPIFSPHAGTYTSAQSVVLSTPTGGASIRYTTDGSTPSETIGMLYAGPVAIDATAVLNATAYKSGFLDSPLTSGTYTLNLPLAATPKLSPAAGTYTSAQWVAFSSATSGAAFLYTTDGSTPTETNGLSYTGPVLIGRTTVLKAIAYETGLYSGSPVAGGIYAITSSPAIVLNVMDDFMGSGGNNPVGGLVQGSDGNFYGTTASGGSGDGNGTIFKMTPSGVLTTLVSFTGANGDTPIAGLVQGRDGNFYGTTSGETNNVWTDGTVFKVTPSGKLTTLFSFDGSNGAQPYAVLMLASDGNFYGTAANVTGIDANNGTVFKITPVGVLTTLVTFTGANGSTPIAGLVQGRDGNFYGTTIYGGMASDGTIFKMTPAGVLTTLATFTGANGEAPNGLVQGSDGNFYGTTQQGGDSNGGTVFKITPAGVLTTLISFDGINEAYAGDMVQGRDGNFYGTTSLGGNGNNGVIFKITPAGVLTALVAFDGPNGASPQSYLIQGSDGNFYGTAIGGGRSNVGAIFELILPPPLPPSVAPVFSPAAGTYTSVQTVKITSSTSGASIRYTTDGSTPSETAGTLYSSPVSIEATATLKAIAYKSVMTDSSVTSGLYTINAVTRSLAGSSGNGFHFLALTSAQSGTFTATFDATPSVSPENAVVGLSKGAASAYSGLSCIARFNPSGDIDAYNGTAYGSSTIPYSANKSYHFRMVVNVTAGAYSVYVTPAGGSELTVGLNYAFRKAATSLDTWNLEVDATPASCSLTANNLAP